MSATVVPLDTETMEERLFDAVVDAVMDENWDSVEKVVENAEAVGAVLRNDAGEYLVSALVFIAPSQVQLATTSVEKRLNLFRRILKISDQTLLGALGSGLANGRRHAAIKILLDEGYDINTTNPKNGSTILSAVAEQYNPFDDKEFLVSLFHRGTFAGIDEQDRIEKGIDSEAISAKKIIEILGTRTGDFINVANRLFLSETSAVAVPARTPRKSPTTTSPLPRVTEGDDEGVGVYDDGATAAGNAASGSSAEAARPTFAIAAVPYNLTDDAQEGKENGTPTPPLLTPTAQAQEAPANAQMPPILNASSIQGSAAHVDLSLAPSPPRPIAAVRTVGCFRRLLQRLGLGNQAG